MADQDDENWRKKLVVKDIPDDWSIDLIQNFLEVVTGAEVEEDGVEYFSDVSHTALVTFTDSLSEECVAKAQQQTKHKGKPLSLELIREGPTSILVRDLDPSLTQDNLFFYFDSPRSGGTEGSVLDEDGCELYPELSMAVVTFSSHGVVRNVLAMQEHCPCRGIRVQVEPCYEQFHKPLLQELAQLSTDPPPSQAQDADYAEPKTPVRHTQSSPTLSGCHRGDNRQNMGGTGKPIIPPKPKYQPRLASGRDSWEYGRSMDDSHQSYNDDEDDESQADLWGSSASAQTRNSRSQARTVAEVTVVFGEGVEENYRGGRGRRPRQNWGVPSRPVETEEQFSYDEAYDGSRGVYSAQPPPPPRPRHVIRLDADCNPLPPEPYLSQEDQSLDTDGENFHYRVSESDSSVSEADGYTRNSSKKTTSARKHTNQFYLQSGAGEYGDESFEIFNKKPSSAGKRADQFYLHSGSGDHGDEVSVSEKDSLGADGAWRQEPQAPARNESSSGADARGYASSSSVQEAQGASDREKQLEEELQKLKRDKEALEKEKEKMKLQKQTTERLPIPPYQLRVLKEFATDFKLCQVTLLEQEGMILFHGNEEDCANAKCIFLTQIQELAEDRRSVPAAISTILKTTQGKKYLSELSQTYPACSVEVQESSVVCAGQNMRTVANLLDDIERNIRKEICKVTTLPGSSELFALKTQLESDLLVLLTLPVSGSSELLVEGINGDVDMAVREVQKHMETNKLGRRLFKKNGEVISQEASENGYKMTFQCRQEVLQEVTDKLRNISVDCKTVDLHASFTSYSERSLVINGLHSYNKESFCLKLEQMLKNQGVSAIFSIKIPPRCQLPKLRYDTQRTKSSKHHSQPKPQALRPSARPPPPPRPHRSSREFRPYTTTIGNTTVKIKTGDISREKVEILVSIVGEDLQMKGTAVGGAILKRFPDVAQDLQTQQPVQGGGCRVIAGQMSAGAPPRTALQRLERLRRQAMMGQRTARVPVSASPPWILHVVLRKLSGPTLTATVKQLTQQCLLKAIQSGNTSIAFPPLGVGRKFGYPADAVADAMTSSIAELLQGNSRALRNVVFVIYDMDTAKKFKVALKQRDPSVPRGMRAAVMVPSDDSQSDDDNADFDDDSYGFDVFDSPQAVTGKAKFEASVCTRNQGDVPAVKALLLKELKSTFLWLDTVKDLATFKKLGTKAMDEIQAAAMKENVILRVYEKDGKVTACGQKADVGQVVSLIKDKILKYMSQEKQEHGPSRRKHKVTGLPANTADIPSYWKICQKGVVRGIQEAIRNMRKLGALHSVDGQEQKTIEQLIQDTWMPQFIGHGKDGVGLAHTNIQVVKVERLENPELWEKYSMLREACIRQLEFNKQSGFTPVEKLPGSKGPVKTTTTLRRGSPLRREVYPLQVNEHYLFHGTKKEYIDAIVKDGLDSRISSPNSMLGRGIYASESATKADQYTDDKRQRTSGNKTMILVRMLLGQPYMNTAQNPTKYDRPPCMKCGKDKCTGCNSKHYNSVIDEAGRNFREFVVYDSNMCYPEYFITYQRV
ncbi:hypothetical protein BaRGS_00021810 [Batillaria attramentaria]|uniref:Poly [ADP-ribose] polymerase n=1 Tax=Batillaria attramentaria TaxID=370345 RepID=A0ABD0KIJ1_9CAEN